MPIPGRTGQVTAGTGVKFYWNECECHCCFGVLVQADGGDRASSRCVVVNAGQDEVLADGENVGPIFTYMAKCDPNCGSFTGTKGPVWFKIGMCSTQAVVVMDVVYG